MKLVHAERLGEAFDSQLVIGVRESYGMSYVGYDYILSNIQSTLVYFLLGVAFFFLAVGTIFKAHEGRSHDF